MAITLAPEELTDAEVTDRIGLGDLDAAARLWVRHWPTALEAAHTLVDSPEAPGLAAEALIGTITAVAVGRGPREDVAGFVIQAVRELGDGAPAPSADQPRLPEIFPSARMTRALEQLPAADQSALREAVAGSGAITAERGTAALTALQRDYLAATLEASASEDCHAALGGFAAWTVGTAGSFSGAAWIHVSTCPVCTEAFHELAHANVALVALTGIQPTAAPAAAAVPITPAPITPAPIATAASAVHTEATAASDETATLPAVPPEDIAEDIPESSPEAEPGRRRRKALLWWGGAAAGTAAVLALVLVVANTGGEDDPALVDAAATPSASPSLDVPFVLEPESTPSADPTRKRTRSAQPSPSATAAPTLAANPAPTAAATSSSAAPSATSKPSSSADKPSGGGGGKPSGSGSKTPTPTPTSSTPEPTPEPTPTPNCNFMQHLFALC